MSGCRIEKISHAVAEKVEPGHRDGRLSESIWRRTYATLHWHIPSILKSRDEMVLHQVGSSNDNAAPSVRMSSSLSMSKVSSAMCIACSLVHC